MMPLIYANVNEPNIVRRVGGTAEVKKHLENLGLIAGSGVTLICELNGSVIVRVKEARVAISREMASKIMV